ncbi:hypothetical protein MAPG_05027 [Magnaporthiopsis poae ATCC 64411]|uniref:Uncharacterized protein n=1 Tax=Magnaporthiopsis poae (strain ATCC 64411 / 73-15) TaxID=644358 RepID=A0A0C4DYB0_MAGP6|nr:hypothetical protein MAPG_05027 [Magnaporthiopsis poae ATCC 64411]
MALWLFRRRTRRKRSIRAANGDDAQVPKRQTAPATSSTTAPVDVLSPLPDAPQLSGTDPVHRRPSRLQRLTRTYSFELGRRDEILVGPRRSIRKSKRGSAPLPPRHAGSNPATSPEPRLQSTTGQEDKEAGAPTHEGAAYAPFGRVPTLYPAKRDSGHLMSRKLSKRRKNSHDREREAELKALRDFIPVRPATDAWTSGRPLRKDNRRVKSGGFAFVKNPWDREQHPSDVSLPLAESIHSSLSSDSEQVSYKVSAFDVLAPKPTLRRTTNPRCTPSQSITGAAPTRADSQRRKISSKSQIPEATLKAHKRVDDLANDLDASDLRELMERDKRRRERKREREQEKIDSRLARRAERERRALEKGRESPANLERGVLGRESVSLGIDTTSAVVTSSRRRQPSASPTKKSDKRPEDVAAASPNGADDQIAERQRPLDVFHRVDSIVLEESTSPGKQDPEEPVMPLAQEQSPKVKGFLRSKKSRSKSPLSLNAQSDISGTPRNASEASSRGPMSWTSFFKWGLRTKRSSGPSSFSNTSRDSMSTQAPAQSQPISPFNVTFIPPGAAGRGTGVPKRTRSRFREDLPEHPLSPPDSRMQSPEFDAMPPVIKEQDSPPADAMPTPSAPINIPGRRHDTPVFDDMRRTPSSLFRDGVEPSPEPQQAMSLASIDSEGSWLSGRIKSGRLSSQTKQRPVQMFEGPDDDMTEAGENADDSAGIADDEYLNRVASRASGMVYPAAWAGHESTGELRPSSDEDDDPRWGAVSGKQPEVVRPSPAGRIKSREGLLNMVRPVTAPDDNSEPGSPTSPASPISNASEDVGRLQRATSINLGQPHARHISAGSARLLDLSPRSSTDIKRKSWSADNRLPETETSQSG